MGLKENVFRLLPVFAQDILISQHGKKLIKQRYGKHYFRCRDQILSQTNLPVEEVKKNQLAQLKQFIDYAKTHSKFYANLYRDIDIKLINHIDDLAMLPIVDKEMLRTNLDDVYTIDADVSIQSFTGGTTGKSLQVRFTHQDFEYRMAYLDAFKIKLGIDPFKARKATFSGREFTRGWATKQFNVFWRNNRAYNQRLYSTFDLTEQNMPFYINNLNGYRPTVINGFVSAIYDVAQFINQNNIPLNFKPDAIFTTSETLLPHHKQLIERVFSAPVYNQYASAEGAPFVTECTQRNLHYNIDTGVIENLPESDEILITSFSTHGTPLIRYKIGDKIRFKSGVCNCGSNHPLVESIDGRQVDHLNSPEYGKVSLSHLADVIKGLPNSVRQIQFQQHAPNHLKVLLNVDAGHFSTDNEKKVYAALVYRFGKSMAIEIDKVNEIAREKSGKFALIKRM